MLNHNVDTEFEVIVKTKQIQLVWAPFHKGLWLIASFLNTRFAIELRLININRTSKYNPLWNGTLVVLNVHPQKQKQQSTQNPNNNNNNNIKTWAWAKLMYASRTIEWPPKRNSRYSRFFRTLLWSTVIFFTFLHRASFPRYNNTKIIKFAWELFILWVVSYGLSFSGFARFPEFRDTIIDSFSSTCVNTYQLSTSYKEISVPMTCLDCKSLSLNSIGIFVRQYTDHWTQYSLNLWTAEAVISRASELWKSGKSRKWHSIRNYS